MAVVLWLVVLGQLAAPEDAPALRVGDSLSGAVSLQDPVVPTDDLLRLDATVGPELHGRRFRLAVDEPGFVHVDLVSPDFDGFLVARSLDGEVLQEDDDGLVGLDARLVLPLDGEEDVLIDVCALYDGEGAFRLDCRPGLATRRDEEPWSEPGLVEDRHRYKGSLRALGPRHLLTLGGLNVLANTLRGRDRVEEAFDLGRRVLAGMEELVGPDATVLAWARLNLALCLELMGELAQAHDMVARSLEVVERDRAADPLELARLRAELARLRHELGALDQAEEGFRQALAVQERGLPADDPDLAMTRNNLAALFSKQGRDAEALALYEQVLDARRRSLGPRASLTVATLGNVASCLLELGEGERGLALYEEQVQAYQAMEHPLPVQEATAWSNLGVVRRWFGLAEEARAALERSNELLATLPSGADQLLAENLRELTYLALDGGDLDRARALAERCLASWEAYQAEQVPLLSGADARVLLESGGRTALFLRLDPALVTTPADRRQAYGHVLAWRGLGLRGARQLRRALAASDEPEVERLLDDLRALAGRLSAAVAGLVAGGPGPGEAALGGLLDERIRGERALAVACRASPPEPPAWQDLRAALPADGALVDILLQVDYLPAPERGDPADEYAGAKLVAWVTRPGFEAPLPVDLGPAAPIRTAVQAFRAALGAGERGGSPGGGRPARRTEPPVEPLSALVWAPLAPHLEGVRQLAVVADDALTGVPFAALTDGAGRHLVEQLVIRQLSDPAQLLGRADPAPARDHGALLAVGDVAFGGASGSAAPGREAAPGVWAPLPGTVAELVSVLSAHGRRWPAGEATTLSAAAAHERALVEALPAARVVHLATHAYVDLSESGEGGALARLRERHPALLAGLVCAGVEGDPGPGADGLLTAEELSWLDLSGIDLMVLSACDTGRGRVVHGQGLLGLRRALLGAGVDTLVASLWPVPDRETARLMERFYAHLWEGDRGAAEALALAQRELLAEQRRTSGHVDPHAWAAFVVDGSGR